MSDNSNTSMRMPTTSQIVNDDFIDVGTFKEYIDGDAKCLPCKPGVYAITCNEKLKYDDGLITKDTIKLRKHIGDILYIGSSNSLNYRISQLINDKGHVASSKLKVFYESELSKIHIKYQEIEDEDEAVKYEEYLICTYGSDNYEDLEEYSKDYEYPPFNSIK